MNNEIKFVVPRPGLIVRDPRTKAIIPADGCNVAWIGSEGRYWRRRVNCGDCTIGVKHNVITRKNKKEEVEVNE